MASVAAEKEGTVWSDESRTQSGCRHESTMATASMAEGWVNALNGYTVMWWCIELRGEQASREVRKADVKQRVEAQTLDRMECGTQLQKRGQGIRALAFPPVTNAYVITYSGLSGLKLSSHGVRFALQIWQKLSSMKETLFVYLSIVTLEDEMAVDSPLPGALNDDGSTVLHDQPTSFASHWSDIQLHLLLYLRMTNLPTNYMKLLQKIHSKPRGSCKLSLVTRTFRARIGDEKQRESVLLNVWWLSPHDTPRGDTHDTPLGDMCDTLLLPTPSKADISTLGLQDETVQSGATLLLGLLITTQLSLSPHECFWDLVRALYLSRGVTGGKPPDVQERGLSHFLNIRTAGSETIANPTNTAKKTWGGALGSPDCEQFGLEKFP
ncbi:hypothetical protein C8Q80DRAFT_1117306 [Daedaleopsis nitida]|nr:hypothetical protein C8Q80DRAFT_1117306 [Daedaleopsis nitida]